LSTLTNAEAAALLYDWPFWARDKQLPPEGDWFVWLLRSGRGFGKTRSGAEWIRARVESGRFGKIALIGQTKADVRDTMVELGESSILKISPPWDMPEYQPSKRRLVWNNGAVATMFSGDEPDQLRGPEHDTVWMDELAKYKYPQETWDNMELGLRIGPCPQVCVTTTPRPIAIIRNLAEDSATIDIVGSTYENAANLSPNYLARILARYEGTRLGRQDLHGQILGDTPGALWKQDIIDAYRVFTRPPLVRVGVAIDPGVSSDENANETGIIVGGIAGDGHVYVFDDRTLRASPLGWAQEAIAGYNVHQADRVIAERNNGGEMVETTLRTVESDIPYTSVWASRGKYTRAEPVAALYEQGRVHHVGQLPELESQLTTWRPGDKSPDRLDALVWLVTWLALEGGDDELPEQPEMESRFSRLGDGLRKSGGRWKKL